MKFLAIGAAAIAAALAFVTPAAAQAQERGFYAGVGGTWFSVGDVDVTGATGRVGYKFNRNLGVEGEASFGVDGDEADFLGTPVDVDLENQYGVYAVGYLPLSDRFEVLGRAGWASVDAQGSFGGFTAGAEDDGLGLGAGVQYHVSNNFAVRADYTRLFVDDEDNDIDGIDAVGVGGVWSF